MALDYAVGLSTLDDAVVALMAQQHIPGAAIAVLEAGNPVAMRGYGFASLELDVPVTPDTAFCIGSLTKQFTTAVVLQMVGENRLSLEERVLPHFPELTEVLNDTAREGWAAITVRHLMTHQSGLKRDPVFFRPTEDSLPPDYIPVLYAWARQEFTPPDLLARMAALPMDFFPGQRKSYSNSGYTLLGMLLERVAGMSFVELLQARVLDPCGMTATRFVDDAVVPGMASGYTWDGAAWQRGGYINPSRDRSAASLVSTVRDLAKWDAALWGDAVVGEESKAAMWTPAVTADGTVTTYGLGWGIGARTGTNGVPHRWVCHGGMWGGFTSFLLRLLDDRLSVIVLTNLGISGRVENGGQRGDPGAIAMHIAGSMIPGFEQAAHGLKPTVERPSA